MINHSGNVFSHKLQGCKILFIPVIIVKNALKIQLKFCTEILGKMRKDCRSYHWNKKRFHQLLNESCKYIRRETDIQIRSITKQC